MFGYQRISIRHQNEIGLFRSIPRRVSSVSFTKRNTQVIPNYPKDVSKIRQNFRNHRSSTTIRDLDLSAQLVETLLAILAAAKNLKDHK